MLAPYNKIIVVNNSGQLLSYDPGGRLEVLVTTLYITPATGKIVYTGASNSNFASTDTLADGAEWLGVEHDNTGATEKYLYWLIQLQVTHDEGLAADGTFDIYYEGAWTNNDSPSDQTGYASAEANKLVYVGKLTWEPNAADDDVMLSEEFLV